MDDFSSNLKARIPQPRSESVPPLRVQPQPHSFVDGDEDATATFEAEVAFVAQQIRELRSLGLTPKQIRDRLPGVSAWAVNCAINRDAHAKTVHPGLRARAKDAERERARALRLEGKTYKQIQRQLGVSSSTLSMWLRDLPHPQPDRAAHAARMRQVHNTRRSELREARKALAYSWIGEVSDRELLLLGVALYWAEGAKDKPYQRRELINFINSDPGMIRLFLRWLDLLGIEETRRQYRVSIHKTADVAAAEEYWRQVVDVPEADFRKPTLKRHNPKTVRKKVGEDYHGCLTVKVLQPTAVYQWVDGCWRGILRRGRRVMCQNGSGSPVVGAQTIPGRLMTGQSVLVR